MAFLILRFVNDNVPSDKGGFSGLFHKFLSDLAGNAERGVPPFVQRVFPRNVLGFRVQSGKPYPERMVNPVIVRGVISSLKKAGIISVAAGKGGAHALKEPSDVTLWDIYAAVNTEEDRQLFGFHDCSKSRCPVAKNMHKVLDRRLLNAEKAVQNSFSGVTMADVMQDMQVGCGVTKEVLLKALNG